MNIDGVDLHPENSHSIEIHEGDSVAGPMFVTPSDKIRAGENFVVEARLVNYALYSFLERQFDFKPLGGFFECDIVLKVWPPGAKTPSHQVELRCVPVKAEVGHIFLNEYEPPSVYVTFKCIEIRYDDCVNKA